MRKDIKITVDDVVNETLTRDEIYDMSVAMLKRLYDAPCSGNTINYASYLEWRKPYAVVDDGTLVGIALPEINRILMPRMIRGGDFDGWKNMMKYAENEGVELVSFNEGRCIQSHWDEIVEIQKNFGLDAFDARYSFWSREEDSLYMSWAWNRTGWSNNGKKSNSYGIGVRELKLF